MKENKAKVHWTYNFTLAKRRLPCIHLYTHIASLYMLLLLWLMIYLIIGNVQHIIISKRLWWRTDTHYSLHILCTHYMHATQNYSDLLNGLYFFLIIVHTTVKLEPSNEKQQKMNVWRERKKKLRWKIFLSIFIQKEDSPQSFSKKK